MPTIPTTLADDIELANYKIRYDEEVKNVLANRPILARILKRTVSKLMEYDLAAIERCISETIDISSVHVNPGKSNTRIVTEDRINKVAGEGAVIYDIKFHILTPDGEARKVIINIEAQQKSNPGYDIVTRAIFYCARLLSAQLKVEFNNDGTDKSQYDNIKKVYSIWICMDCPKDKRDSIISFSMTPEILYSGNKDLNIDYRYDLVNAVIIHLNKIGDISEDKLIAMLDTLLDNTMEIDVKKTLLENNHNLPMTAEIEKGVLDMCNLSSGIENRGREIGFANGFADGQAIGEEYGRTEERISSILSLMNKLKLTAESAMDALNIPVAEYSKYIDMINDKTKGN